MGLQTATYTQPYGVPGIGGMGMNSLPAPAMPAYGPGMTQLPSMPQPFFNSTVAPMGASMSEIPPPWQVAPAVMSGATTPYTLAESVPIASGLPTPEIPAPQLVAPWLYFQKPAMSQPYPNPYGMNGMNGLNGLNGQNGMQPKQPTPPAPAPAPPPQPKGPTTDIEDSGLSDATIRSLNEQLNSHDESVRADATMDLYKILEKNSNLATDPVYSPYIHAFMEKIMKDPSTLVRGGGELILDQGLVSNPTDTVLKRLTSLSKVSNLTGESDHVGGILGRIKSGTLQRAPKPKSTTDAAAQPAQPTTPPAEGAQAAQPPQQPAFSPQGAAYPGNPGMDPAAFGMPQQPMPGFPAGYGMQQPNPYAQQAFPGFMPQAGGLPPSGARLNLMSPQQQMMPAGPGFPQFGQRLNIQEGY